MKFLLLAVILFLSSCAQKVDRHAETKGPIYYPPVKGSVENMGRGLFIKSRCGDYVRAVETGRVVYSGRDLENYGWVVIIEQKDGYISVYGKMGKPWVKTGEKVKVRQVIGKVGRRRGICGLYYELRRKDGQPVKPSIRW